MSQLQSIQSQIDQANFNYYNKGVSLLTDAEYDGLISQLRDLNPDDFRLKSVGAEPTLDKVEHDYPMGSLDNIDINKPNELETYAKRIEDVAAGRTYTFHVTPKIDGSSIALTYENGVLVRAVTRGNGLVGQDITAKVHHFKNVPTRLPDNMTITVRGEAVMHRDDFAEYLTIAELDGVRNPRNIGNGIIVRKDCCGAGLITFYAFNALLPDFRYTKVMEMYSILNRIGFVTPPSVVCNDLLDVQAEIRSFVDKKYPYDVDGMVIRLNEYHLAELYNHDGDVLRPRSDRALKFNDQKAETTIIGVNNTVGHSGKITPTLMVDPVHIGGVVVSNVLIYNFEEPKRLKLGIGDKIQIVLAGNVIPKVIALVDKSKDNHFIQAPECCPSCSSNLEKRDLLKGESIDLYCSNKECPGVKLVKLKNFIGSSKRGMGILGIGDQLIEKLVSDGTIKKPSDFFNLTIEDLENLTIGNGKFGTKRSTQVIDNIQNSKSNSVAQVISSLGIETLGSSRANLMIELANGALDNLIDWLNKDIIYKLVHKDLPPSHLVLINNQISEIADEIKLLSSMGVGSVSEKKTDADLPLSGVVFCFTGTREMLDDVEKLGGKIASGVSKNVHYLVQKDKDSSSSKSQKAKSLGIKVIDLSDLKELINGK